MQDSPASILGSMPCIEVVGGPVKLYVDECSVYDFEFMADCDTAWKFFCKMF